MIGVKSPYPPLQQEWGRAADHYATHDGTMRTIRACTEYGTTAPDHYSHDQSEIVPHFPPPMPRPSTPSQTARTETPRRPDMTGRTATIPKDRNHSLNSGTPASPCSSSIRSTDAMSLQCRSRRHRIRPPEASGLLPRQGSSTHHLVTLYLLEAIKGARRDHSRG
jgi:hypothetical protein